MFMPISAHEHLPACSEALPRFADKSWWLTKQVAVFAPTEMDDLVFEPAIPVLGQRIQGTNGLTAAQGLAYFGDAGVPALLNALSNSNAETRKIASRVLISLPDPRVTAAMRSLFFDPDHSVRYHAFCYAQEHWDLSFLRPLTKLLNDTNVGFQVEVTFELHRHLDDSAIAICNRFSQEDGLSTKQEEAELLFTNSTSQARLLGLEILWEVGSLSAVERMISMLDDRSVEVRYYVAQKLTNLTGQKFGTDNAAWKTWWASNKSDFKPRNPTD